MLEYIFAVLIFSDYTLTIEKHNPQVYEETEEDLLEIPREARRYGDNYGPHIYIYNKTSQPDLQKLRYYQQQKVDFRNLQIIRKRPHFEGSSRNNRNLLDQSHNISESRQASVRRQRIIHPKLYSLNRSVVVDDQLIKMQTEYGKKETQPTLIDRIKDRANYSSENEYLQSVPRVIAGDDLEVAGTDIVEFKAQVDREDQISPNILFLNSQPSYIDPTVVAESLSARLPSTLLSDLSYTQNNQNDIDILNSLLGRTNTQEDDSKKLSGSQLLMIPSSYSESQVSQSTEAYSGPASRTQLEQSDILKRNGPDLGQLQAQLDIISRKEGEKAIAVAQQKAFDYVKSQQKAIERAEMQAKNLAVATITAHNFQPAISLPQSLPLTQYSFGKERVHTNVEVALQPITEKPHDGVSLDVSIPDVYSLVYPEINYNTTVGPDPIIKNALHAQLQAEAYEKLAAKGYAEHAEDLRSAASLQEKKTQNGYDVKYAPNYAFGYRVMDYHSGLDYGHEETRDGDQTKGKYHVLLPDGRIQNVNYWADPSGYHAKVTYSDVAQH